MHSLRFNRFHVGLNTHTRYQRMERCFHGVLTSKDSWDWVILKIGSSRLSLKACFLLILNLWTLRTKRICFQWLRGLSPRRATGLIQMEVYHKGTGMRRWNSHRQWTYKNRRVLLTKEIIKGAQGSEAQVKVYLMHHIRNLNHRNQLILLVSITEQRRQEIRVNTTSHCLIN